MAKPNIDIPPLFKRSYELFKSYPSFIIGVMTTFFILGLVPQVYLFLNAVPEPDFERQFISIIALLVQLFLALGFTKIMLFIVDDRPVDINDLVNNGRTYFSYVVAHFIYIIVVSIGLFLFIIPGVYLAIRLLFYPYYIIEYGDTSFIAIQKSWQATDGWMLELLLFGVCVLGLNVLGTLCFGIGVILTYPITTMATAIVFKGLDDGADDIP